MDRVELRHLRAFLAIAEEGTITRAAQHLRIAQPALSRTLRQLEDRLGVVLVDRSTTHLALTPAGEVFRDRCQAVLAALEDAIEAVGGRARPLRLGHAWAAAGERTTALVRAWSAAHPDQPIEVHCIMERTAGLLRGAVDVALLRGPIDEPGLGLVRLPAEPRVAVLALDHPLAGATSLRLADLAGEAIVVNEAYGTTTTRLWPSGARPVRTVAVDNTDDWLTAIAVGQGVGVTPVSTAYLHQRAGVTYVPLDDAPPVPVALAWLRVPSHPAVPEFVRLARATLLADHEHPPRS